MTPRRKPSLRRAPERLRAERAPTREPRTRLELLGGFALVADGSPLPLPHRAERLLAFLALHDRPLHRAYVSGRLWPDRGQEQAFGSLRTATWSLPRLETGLIASTATHVSLAPAVEVDARELAARTARLLHPGSSVAEDDVAALTRARELLPGWYEDWVLQEREQVGQLRLLALEAACEALLAAERYADACAAALAVVVSDPLRESARRLLMRACAAAGNVAEALRQYALYRARLERDVGIEPSPRMLELVLALRNGSATTPEQASSRAASLAPAR